MRLAAWSNSSCLSLLCRSRFSAADMTCCRSLHSSCRRPRAQQGADKGPKLLSRMAAVHGKCHQQTGIGCCRCAVKLCGRTALQERAPDGRCVCWWHLCRIICTAILCQYSLRMPSIRSSGVAQEEGWYAGSNRQESMLIVSDDLMMHPRGLVSLCSKPSKHVLDVLTLCSLTSHAQDDKLRPV